MWFEYIRTDANVADEPSRADLSGARYELGAEPAAGIAAFTHSKPVRETVLPSLDEWDANAVAWALAAQRRTSCGPTP